MGNKYRNGKFSNVHLLPPAPGVAGKTGIEILRMMWTEEGFQTVMIDSEQFIGRDTNCLWGFAISSMMVKIAKQAKLKGMDELETLQELRSTVAHLLDAHLKDDGLGHVHVDGSGMLPSGEEESS